MIQLRRACALLFVASLARAQSPAAGDSSPHSVSMVRVDAGVQLEVLDWGGTGLAMVFLADAGNSAHVFDSFAPRFGATHHVYGITRRGAGASSRAGRGYDIDSRVRDVLSVLDSLHLERAVIVAHSFAADEASRLAVTQGSRIHALVYLDAGDYSPAAMEAMSRVSLPAKAVTSMTAADSSSLQSAVAYYTKAFGVELPVGEILATSSFDGAGRLVRDGSAAGAEAAQAALMQNGALSEYVKIGRPALAIFPGDYTARQLFPRYARFDTDTRTATQRFVSGYNAWKRGVRERLASELGGAVVQVIDGANHFIFLSNADQVEKMIRDFLGALPR